MKLSIQVAATSQTVNVFIRDSSSTTGAGLTGLVFNSASLTAYYALPLAAPVAITLATLAAITTAWSSGGFKEVDATNMPGWYRLDIPNAALASGRFVSIHLKGATNMAPLPLEIELTGWNNQDAVRGGLTALPNVASGSSGAIPTVGTGTAQLSVSSGQVILQSGTGTGQLDFTSGVMKANIAQILGTALTETAGLLAGGFKKFFNVATPTGTVNSLADAVPGAAGGGFIAGSNATTTANITGTITGNLSGSVGSVTAGVGLTALESSALQSGTAQAGGASTITLASGASATDNLYRGLQVKIYGGTGAGQTRVITAYVGSTKVATVDTPWITNPDSSSTYSVQAMESPKLDTSQQVTAASVQGNVTGSVGSVTAGVTLAAAAVQAIWDALTSALTTVGSVGKLLVDNITGNAFTRLGAPVGASISADIAAVKTQVVTINADTDDLQTRLPAALVSGRMDSSVGAYPGNTAQTGDNFARLGAPVGASISADVAAVKAQVVTINADTDDIQTRLPAALVSGRIDASVGAYPGNTAQTGDNFARLGVPVGASISADIAGVQADTDNIQTRIPAALVSGRIDASVGAVAANAITAAAIADGAIDRATFAADTGLGSVRSNTAQAGASGTITLDASASATDTYYVGLRVLLTGGTGAGQSRTITAYVGATKVATLDRNWVTNPDSSSTFALMDSDGPSVNSSLQVATTASDPWSTALPGAYGAGTAGNILGTNLDATITSRTKPADTQAAVTLVSTLTTYTGNTPQTGDSFARLGAAGAGLTALGDTRIANLDATVTSRTKPADTQAAVTTVTNLTNAPTSGDFTATMKTSLNAATPAVTVSDKTGFSLSTAGILAIWNQLTSALTTAATIGKLLVDNISGNAFTRIGAPAGASISADIAAIKAVLPTALVSGRIDSSVGAMAANTVTASALATDAVGEISDGIWDEPLAGHLSAGSTGEALDSAGGAADPWNTMLPGAYPSGSAGEILGTNLNVAVSSRLASASYTAPDNADVLLIKAKTDLIPTVPAAVGDIPTAVQNADALLARNIAGGSTGGRTVKDSLRPLRNKVASAAGVLTVYQENDTSVAWTSVLTTDPGAEPIVSSDPV